MVQEFDLEEIDRQLQLIKKAVEELGAVGGQFPAVDRNLVRIRANLKMLELNVSDVIAADR